MGPSYLKKCAHFINTFRDASFYSKRMVIMDVANIILKMLYKQFYAQLGSGVYREEEYLAMESPLSLKIANLWNTLRKWL